MPRRTLPENALARKSRVSLADGRRLRDVPRWTAACWTRRVRPLHLWAAVPRRRGVGREARGWGMAFPR
jgi:hypothetical protein